MRCRCRILGISWTGRVTNAEVSSLTGLPDITSVIARRRHALFGHIASIIQHTKHSILQYNYVKASTRMMHHGEDRPPPRETASYVDWSARARYWHLSRPVLEHRGRRNGVGSSRNPRLFLEIDDECIVMATVSVGELPPLSPSFLTDLSTRLVIVLNRASAKDNHVLAFACLSVCLSVCLVSEITRNVVVEFR